MRLFRRVVPLLVAGILPCVAQSPTPKPPVESAPSKAQNSPQSNEQKQPAIKLSVGDSMCYSIRDYRFAVPKDSQIPKLTSYSTCVPAARFEARDVTKPSSGPVEIGTMGSTSKEGR
jgi:hypothetical protein